VGKERQLEEEDTRGVPGNLNLSLCVNCAVSVSPELCLLGILGLICQIGATDPV
jgi:hypothetical protein